MSKQVTLDEADFQNPDVPSGETLFRVTSDPYVNEAIADLAVHLNSLGSPQVRVEADAVFVREDADKEAVIEDLENRIWSRIDYTHRRKAVAFAINRTLDEIGAPENDARRIEHPGTPFPDSDDDLTVFEDDTVDRAKLESQGIDPDKVEANLASETGLFALSPEYVGNPSSRSFPSQVDRFERYFGAYAEGLRGEFEGESEACMSCGWDSMPSEKDSNGDYLEYNQTFTVYASTTGASKPLGQKARDSKHRGRCAACLVAGFYYSFMPKTVRQTASNENDSRIFAPVGPLDELYAIRKDLDAVLEDMTEPSEAGRSRRQSLGSMYTDSEGMQTIDFYETVRREVNSKTSGGIYEKEIERRPTALAHYVSEIGQTRTIDSMETIDPQDWAYEAVAERSLDSGEEYWPVGDVLRWFASIDGDATRGLVEDKDGLAYGILRKDLKSIERSIFQFFKTTERNDGANAPYTPNQAYVDHYFTDIMNQATADAERIDEDAIESIKRVGSSIGQLFHSGEDIGILIQLQNASTSEEFLSAFEKAAMQAQKLSTETPPSQWEASRNDDVSTVLELISDSTTFEPAKRMFVIHASLAAQYQNVRDSDAGGEADE